MSIKRTELFLASLAVFAVSFIAAGVRPATAISYEEGVTPYFIDLPDNKGYGGTNLSFNDGVHLENGRVVFKVFYPTAAAVSDFGALYSGFGYWGLTTIEGNNHYKVSDAIRECGQVDGGTVCSFKRDVSLLATDFNNKSPVPHFVEYRKNNGQTARAVNKSDPDKLTDIAVLYLLVPGIYSPGAVIFDNDRAETITDPSVKNKSVSVLSRTDTSMTYVSFNLGGDIVTVKEYEEVKDSRFYKGTARRYTANWNVQPLPAGSYDISANAYGLDGRFDNVYVKDRIDTEIKITLAVSINQKLSEQCEQSKAAVQSLIDTVTSGANEKSSKSQDLFKQVLEYRKNKILNPKDETTTLEGNLLGLQQSLRSKTSKIEQSSNVSCAVSINDEISSYKTVYEKYTTQLDEYSDALIQYISAVITEAEQL